jgi:hypothetical protein
MRSGLEMLDITGTNDYSFASCPETFEFLISTFICLSHTLLFQGLRTCPPIGRENSQTLGPLIYLSIASLLHGLGVPPLRAFDQSKERWLEREWRK